MSIGCLFKKIYFIDYAITVVPFFLPFIPLHPVCHLLPSFPHHSSCPWVVHISSLSSLFPILFLTSPHLFNAYQLCFFFPVSFPAFLPSHSQLKTLHVMSISLILFLFQLFAQFLFSFSFIFLGSFVDSCQFVVILLFIFFIFFFFDKSL